MFLHSARDVYIEIQVAGLAQRDVLAAEAKLQLLDEDRSGHIEVIILLEVASGQPKMANLHWVDLASLVIIES